MSVEAMPECPGCRERDRRIAELEAEAADLRRQVASLQRQIVELQRLVAELTEQLKKNSSNSSNPPSTDAPHRKPAPPRKRSGKKRGGQPGHARAIRPLVPPHKVSEFVDHKPRECRHCGAGLVGSDPEPGRHQIAELPPIEPTIIEHRLHRLHCSACGHSTRAQLPSIEPRGHFGPRLAAVLSLLSGGYRIGKRGVKQLTADLFGLDISLGMISKLERQTAQALERPVAKLLEHVRSQDVHVDETGWRENKRRAWLWVAVAPNATVFRIAPSRSASMAKELLGENFSRVAICDRFRGYLWIENVQLCWAHLRRDFQAMIDRGGKSRPIGEELLFLSNVLFEWWHRVRDGTMARSTFQRYLIPLRREIRDELERGAHSGCAKTQATCRELLQDELWLWTFARREGIEPTNNAAERALRHAVLWRKSSFGSDSAAGSRFVERVLSVAATCRQQGRHLLDTLTQCLRAWQSGRPPASLLQPSLAA